MAPTSSVSYAKGIVLFLFVLNFITKGSLAFLKLFCLHTISDFHFLLYVFVLSTMSNTSAHLYYHLNDALSVRLLNNPITQLIPSLSKKSVKASRHKLELEVQTFIA